MPGQTRAPQQTAPETSTTSAVGTNTEAPAAERNVDGVPADLEVTKEALATAAADDGTDGEALLAQVARLMRYNPAQSVDVLGDEGLMCSLAAKMSGDQTTMAMLYLGADLVAAVRWVHESGGLNEERWGRLVAGRTGAEILAALYDDAAFARIRLAVSGSAIESVPGLALDPGLVEEAARNIPLFVPWLIMQDGMVRCTEILARVGEYEADKTMRESLIADGTYDYQVAIHQEPTTEPRDARRLYNWLLCTTDVAEAMKLFKKRFGIELREQQAREDDASTPDHDETLEQGDWDYTSVVRVWQICARLPPDQVATAKSILRTGMSGGAGGWANAEREIGMSWGTDQMGSTENGAFTEDFDPMRGLNVFDATMRHEIGHTVGFANGFDAEGGFVWTVFGWQEEDWRTLLRQTFVPAFPFPDEMTDEEKEFATRGLAQAAAFDEEGFKAAVDAVGARQNVPDLWTKIEWSDLLSFLLARATEGAWETIHDIGGRSYHVDYPPHGSWVSCPVSLYGTKVSTYAMRSPAEWFAEVYATFYADADRPGVSVGSTLMGRDPLAYAYMMSEVHTLWNLFNMTGQSMGHDTMGV